MSTAALSLPASPATSPAVPVRHTVQSQLRDTLLDTLVPLGIYMVARRLLGLTEVQALLATAAQPLFVGVRKVASGTRLSPTNLLVFGGILVTLIALMLGGTAQILLLRESILTAALGVACLASLPSKRPLLFFFVRHSQVGNQVEGVAAFNQRLRATPFLHTMRVMTAIWGLALLAEFSLRAWMVWHCAPTTVLAASPFLLNGTIFTCIAWSVRYGKRRQAHVALRQLSPAVAVASR